MDTQKHPIPNYPGPFLPANDYDPDLLLQAPLLNGQTSGFQPAEQMDLGFYGFKDTMGTTQTPVLYPNGGGHEPNSSLSDGTNGWSYDAHLYLNTKLIGKFSLFWLMIIDILTTILQIKIFLSRELMASQTMMLLRCQHLICTMNIVYASCRLLTPTHSIFFSSLFGLKTKKLYNRRVH